MNLSKEARQWRAKERLEQRIKLFKSGEPVMDKTGLVALTAEQITEKLVLAETEHKVLSAIRYRVTR